MAHVMTDFEKHALSVIRPLRSAQWQADFTWDDLEVSLARMAQRYGGLDLTPDFQRGHVWTPSQQLHFIENCLRGVVASSGFLLQFNCPSWTYDAVDSDLPPGLQCVDGLQRYTAVTQFCAGHIQPFGFNIQQLALTRFSPARFHMKIAVHDFTRREDLLDHYLSINAGGTPHSPEEISRVRDLLAQARQ